MRTLAAGVLAATVLAGCSTPPQSAPPPVAPAPVTASQTTPAPIDAERIRRVRADLPPDFEVADVGGYASSPVAFWGFGRGWTAEPARCTTLVDPAPDGPADGVSASGPGGILYVVVVTAPVGPVGFDPVLLGECGHWLMTYGRASADVHLADAPAVAGAATLGLVSTIRNLVESGTETASRADTFMAYLGEHVVFVTLVTDPGSMEPPLPPQFASDLLVKTVATLRG